MDGQIAQLAQIGIEEVAEELYGTSPELWAEVNEELEDEVVGH